MPKEEEVVTEILEFVNAAGKKDYIQEVTEHFTAERHGGLNRSEKGSYRRMSDRAELARLSDSEFKVTATGETFIIFDRSPGQIP